MIHDDQELGQPSLTNIAVETIVEHIKDQRSLSLIRIGDGESRLLGWPKHTPREDLELPLRRWFGSSDIAIGDIRSLQCDLIEAIQGSDIIGVPDENHIATDKYWSLIKSLVDEIERPEPALYCDMNIHVTLHKERLFERILRNLDWVGVVNCHDIGERLCHRYGIQGYQWHEITAEFATDGIGDSYLRLYDALKVPYPGAVYLIGAGILGKVACKWIKDQGGIAIDIGSIFDAWGGTRSRGYMHGQMLDFLLPAQAEKPPTIDIIIPTMGNRALLDPCLESIAANTPQSHNVILGDNSQENLGFARRVNQCIAESTADYVMLLNDDTVVPPGWLDNMLKVLQSDKQVALVGPLSSAPSQWQWQHNMARMLGRNLPENDYVYQSKADPGSIKLPGHLAFWCTLFPRHMFDELGLLDEQFFIYGEDDDWCLRAMDAGYKMALDLSTVVTHHHRQSYGDEQKKAHAEAMAKLQNKWQGKLSFLPSVMMAVLNQGQMRIELGVHLMHILAEKKYNLRGIAIIFSDQKPIASNRNSIVKRFLDTDHDYLLQIDSDTVPLNNPLDLVHWDLDIIGLPTPIYYPEGLKSKDDGQDARLITWNVARFSEEEMIWYPLIFNSAGKAGLMEVDAIGTGCMLVHRRVFEHPDMRGPFVRAWDEDGIAIRGLDYEFCRRAREVGFKVWMHTDYTAAHYKTANLNEMWSYMPEKDVLLEANGWKKDRVKPQVSNNGKGDLERRSAFEIA